MTNKMANILIYILGRRNIWRLCRHLYLKARADTINDAATNGEQAMQQQLLNRFVLNQDKLIAFDVGANVGDWTCFLLEEASRLHLDGRINVHSFEPAPNTFSVLKQRIDRLKLHNCAHLVSRALSSSIRTAEMFIAGENAGTNSLHQDLNNHDKTHILINTTTMYSYCTTNNIQLVHFAKCDTEGHDMDVLTGAKKLFDEQRIMAFQFEYNHRWVFARHYLKDVFDMFKNTAYSIGKITPTQVELYQEWHPELERFFEGNYIVIHASALDWFNTVRGRFDTANTYCASAI